MADIDLRLLRGDTVVVYFGGKGHSVDAYTFANALIAIADTARSVNAVLYPGEDIEIILDGTEPGSFRARLRRIQKGAPGFFSRGAETLFWTAVGLVFLDPLLSPPPRVSISVNTQEVVIEDGDKTIIVPRYTYDAMANLRKSPDVQANVASAFKAMEGDSSLRDFGLAPDTTPKAAPPVFTIPQEDFSGAVTRLAIPPEIIEKTRPREEKARVLILKAWLNHSSKKWSFEWNGVPISAPVKDDAFLNTLDSGENRLGAGDALDVVLTFKQNFVESLGVYETDPTSFVVKEVVKLVPRNVQARL